ncbi:MAG: NUDIX hydrolase [Clostridiaceae bacterium]|jgi:8-oxo-dGTP pyrophosphatase MutT (NUDIX family)|nr:NUDIX hydrolase [Clostridiales bacterium]MDD2441009.1 NUDIX hydrolase [Eubacteriales bacterium]MDD4140737.1 NUDIX hydrolase [Eubacteriales bacterium]MDD4745504.1 NUDIX hydrolase [Eubacteriales bacterium]NLB43758.1 NUDIX hydrolase [Clostridiaceae bacterium]
MLVRNCSGGVVFSGDRVLLLMNDKHEWVFPKGVIRSGDFPDEVAVRRVQFEGNIKARIVSSAGRTNYEFYSISRQRPVCNKIVWYIMTTEQDTATANEALGFLDAGFFPIEDAMDKVTYSQDKSLLMLSYQKYKELVQST